MNIKALSILALALLFCNSFAFSQQKNIADTVIVQWRTLEDAFKEQETTKRYIFTYLHSNDPRYAKQCKWMEDSAFTDPTIVSFLNKRFIPVRLDANSKDTITYFDSTYTNRMGYHDAAIQMMDAKLSFPSIVFFDKDKRKSVMPGYTTKIDMLPLLIYILEDVFTTTQLDEFKQFFFKTYPPNNKSGYSMVRSLVKWKSLDEALSLSKQSPKKIALVFDVSWSTSSTMMSMTSFNDKDVAGVLADDFYTVRIDATTKDTLHFGADYINPNEGVGYHQLPVAMLNGNMKFPSLLILNENSKLVNTVQGYLAPEHLEAILSYYAKDAYLSTPWDTFLAEFEKQKEAQKTTE